MVDCCLVYNQEGFTYFVPPTPVLSLMSTEYPFGTPLILCQNQCSWSVLTLLPNTLKGIKTGPRGEWKEGENWHSAYHVTGNRTYKSWNTGWTSADRSTRATLMLTVPSFITKSSTKDLTWPTFCIAVKYCVDPKAIGTPTPVKVNIVIFQHGFWLRGVQS